MISRTEIQDAGRRIVGHVRRTPVIALEDRAFGLDAKIFLKLECLQHTGSFKPRGAFNCILSSSIPPAGVIAASGGNHGAVVAHAAQKLGHRAEIFVPATTPANKVDRLWKYGASVNIFGNSYAEALAASSERAAQTGAVAIHAYDDQRVLAGQGTLGMELEEQVRGLDSVLIAQFLYGETRREAEVRVARALAKRGVKHRGKGITATMLASWRRAYPGTR